VQILPRATASHQPGSKTRWREETNVRSRVEHVSRVCIEPRKVCASCGPARDNHPRMPDPRVWEPWTVARRWNTVSALPLSARQGRGHRGRRPDHAEKGITRELVSASSASCLEIAEQYGGEHSGGSPPRDQSSRRKGPPPRRVDPSNKTRGRQVRRDKREREGSPEGREAVLVEHSSDGLSISPNNRTRARRRASPAGRHVRAGGNEAGKPGNHRRPWDLVERRRSRASSPNQGRTWARDSEPGARPAAPGTDRNSGPAVSRHGVHHARPSPRCGDAERAFGSLNPQSAPGVDRVPWQTYKANLETNLVA